MSGRFGSLAKDALYPHADLSASQLEREWQKVQAESSKHGTTMIDAGRGQERPSETRGKSDSLSQKVNALADRWNQIVDEMARRKKYSGSHKPIPQANRQSFSRY